MVKINDDKEKDEEKIKTLEEKNEELTNSWKRALADYQNLEKRQISQQAVYVKQGIKDFIKEMLVVLDSLYQAEEHLNDNGLKLVIKEFEEILKKNGVVKIETLDQMFDPSTMECLEVVEGEEGKVTAELRRGYLFDGDLLRPAQVKVGKKTVPVIPDSIGNP